MEWKAKGGGSRSACDSIQSEEANALRRGRGKGDIESVRTYLTKRYRSEARMLKREVNLVWFLSLSALQTKSTWGRRRGRMI